MIQRHAEFARPLQSVLLLAVPFVLGSCTATSTSDSRALRFPTSQVGAAVVILTPSEGGKGIDSLRADLGKALSVQLEAKGYEPTLLHAVALPGSFSMQSVDGTRRYRSRLQEPVFAAAQRDGLSGTVVLWVNTAWSTPTEEALGFRASREEEPVLKLSARLEIYSSAGESVGQNDAFLKGIEDIKITNVDGAKAVASYRVLSTAELADKLTRDALSLVNER